MAIDTNAVVYSGTAQYTNITSAGFLLPAAGSPKRGYDLRLKLDNAVGTPILTAKIQASRDGGTTWLDRVYFANAGSNTSDAYTGIGTHFVTVEANTGMLASAAVQPQIRLNATITGGQFDVECAFVTSKPG